MTATRSPSPRPPSPASRTSCSAPFRAAQSSPPQPRAGLRGGRRVPEALVPGRSRVSSIRSCWWWKDRSRTRRSRRKATGRRWGPTRDRPADHDQRLDRPAGAQGPRGGRPSAPAPPTAGSTPWKAIPPAAWAWPTISAGTGSRRPVFPIVNVPGCPVQPDNFMETLLYLLYQVAGLAPMIPLDDQLRPHLALRQHRARGLRPRRLLRAGRLRHEYGSPKCIVKLGCWGPVVNCNVPKRGWMAGIGGCPNVGGICIGCTMPGFPDKFMPFMDEPPGARALHRQRRGLRPGHQRAPLASPTHGEQGAEVAAPASRADDRLSSPVLLSSYKEPPR